MAILKSSKPAGDAYHTHKQHSSAVPKPPVLRNGIDPKRRVVRPAPQAEFWKEGGGAAVGAGDAPGASNANSTQGASRPRHSQHQPNDDFSKIQRPSETAKSALSSAKSGGSPQVSFVDNLPSESQAAARNSGAPCPKTPKSPHNEIAALTKTPPAQHRRAASTVRTAHNIESEWNSAQQRSRDSSVATVIESSPRVNSRDDNQPSSRSNNSTIDAEPSTLSPRALRRSSTRGSSIGTPVRSAYQYDEDSRTMEDDRDQTLRTLEGAGERHEGVRIAQEDEQKTEDLFLNLAQDDSTRFVSNASERAERRKSRMAIKRQSMPPISTTYTPPRRDFEYRSNMRLPSPAELPAAQPSQGRMSSAATYRTASGPLSSRASTYPRETSDRSRYFSGGSDGVPLTPKAVGSKREIYEVTPEDPPGQSTPTSESGMKLPIRSHSYRRSNLSYSGPRVYNSSPLVPRALDTSDNQTPQNSAPETDSTASTTAPSTVWDELDDLKSRIKKLELTGKLPATSGAAVTPSPQERPRTATTTITTISSSPKQQGRGSVSPNHEAPSIMPEAHPLLHEALAKAKTLLGADIYRALESSASDALNLAAMFGTSGGSVAGGSVVGGGSISERQIRRKADSMCRSLTELCLALCDGKSESQAPVSREIMGGSSFGRRSPGEHGVSKAKPSPRAMSRLDGRRSSMVASAIPGPHLSPSEAGTPTQFTEGRKGSLLLRNRRGADELEDEDTSRFRAPSRATTDIGRTRLSPRDYASQPLPSDRSPSVLSNLPSRRHFMHSSGVPPSPTTPGLGARRYLDRTNDTSSVVSRLAEDRGQRKPSISGGSFESAISRTQTVGSGISSGSGLSRAGSITRNRRRTETEGSASAAPDRY